jgi:hypothetical protein
MVIAAISSPRLRGEGGVRGRSERLSGDRPLTRSAHAESASPRKRGEV